ncbi:MAG: magnesium and cobalt transport protein CorA, partial [Spirochaetaceae bacterium]
ALMDAMVDNYFLVVEHFADRVEELDELIAGDPPADAMREIHLLRREVLGLRKVIWPLREAMSLLYKGELQLIRPETRMFLRDLYDHTIQLLDMIESFREVLGGLHDAYLSATNNRMNEIMKVLTIIATIFIPLTFIAGIYGMNFEHMPELAWPAAYFVVLGVMLLIGAGMLVFFRRKRWL